jgi:1,4-dihydroxy-6-naphthoate synthase
MKKHKNNKKLYISPPSQSPSYSLAYSSCPNDTFIFKAIAHKLIDLRGHTFNIVLEDVETLNKAAQIGSYDITKLSFAAFGNLINQYALLKSGSALGLGCGPLIVSLPGQPLSERKKIKAAVPGMGTTAYLLFRFFMQDKFPEIQIEFFPMTFNRIMPAVLEKQVDCGVIIHEGRFVYPSLGLEMLADLGLWWENKTGLPLPLGCIAIKRSIDPAIAGEVQELIKQSIVHAFQNPDIASDYIKSHAVEMEESVIQQHISLYVNDYSIDIGDGGERAIKTFFEMARSAGYLQQSDMSLFAET